MALRDEFEHSGAWLFRYRSYLPIALGVPLILAMRHFTYPGGTHFWDVVWDVTCVSISMAGLVVRAITVGHAPARTSGRNTSSQVADTLNTTGMYSLVRHPLYLGNFLMWLGVFLFPHSVWLAAFFVLAFIVYYERIMFAEESFLREQFGARFEVWAARTPAMVPNPLLWTPPALSFSLRTVLKREYSGFFALAILFTLMEVSGEFLVERHFDLELGWVIFLGAGTVAYVVLRWLKRHTRLLHVDGR